MISMSAVFTRDDKKWQSFNKKLVKYMKENNFFMLGSTYYEMAYFVKSDKKQFDYLRVKGYEMKLRSQLEIVRRDVSSGVISSFEIVSFEGSCNSCKKLNGATISINEALEHSPIPNKDCTFVPVGCRCVTTPIVE